MLKQLLWVTLGGGLGSVTRYLIATIVSKHFPYAFPLGTFIINITGCLLIGLLLGLSIRSNGLRLLLVVGFCGGYTTFSTFASESLKLLQTGNYGSSLVYMLGSVTVGVVAVWVGFLVSKII